MSDMKRASLEMAIEGLKADLARVERAKGDLLQSDRIELQMVMARLNSLLSQRQAA
jgi:hypothetical protein